MLVRNIHLNTNWPPNATSDAILFFLLNHHGIESIELWDIKGSEGYIYAAFKIWSED